MNIEFPDPIIKVECEYEYGSTPPPKSVTASVTIGGVVVLSRRRSLPFTDAYGWKREYLSNDEEKDFMDKVTEEFALRLRDLISGALPHWRKEGLHE